MARTVTHRAPMSTLEELAERVERLLLRLEESRRTVALLEQQLSLVTTERDNLKSRLSAARGRIDALLQRLPADVRDADGGAA
jgi:cell division protein ZapB